MLRGGALSALPSALALTCRPEVRVFIWNCCTIEWAFALVANSCTCKGN